MQQLIFFCLLILASLHALADEFSVIDVRRNITLSDEDTVYKDFYINAGADAGLKKNLVVTAVRKISVRDASGAQAYGEVMIPVGQLRVIATYGKIAVAREYKLLSRDELPMIEQTGIMTGDRIDLQGSFVDNSKPKYPKPKVAVAPPTPGTPPSPAAAAVVSTAAPTTAVGAPAPAPPTAAAAITKPPSAAEAAAITTAEPAKEKGPAPASVAEAEPTTSTPPSSDHETEKAEVPSPEPQKLEKVADSGNNSAHE